MPYSTKEKQRAYHKEWKRKKRRALGIPLKGQHKRKEIPIEVLEERKQKRREYERKWKKEYGKWKPEKRLLWAAKRRAKDRGLPFNLVEADIIVPTHCPILGIPLVATRPRGDSRKDIASLDRVDSTKGYTKDNIEVISWLANTMKQNATKEELVAFSKTMLERYGSNI